MSDSLRIQNLGQLSYDQAFKIQTDTHAAVLAGNQPPTILLVEHDPVFTVTKKPGARQHLIASEQLLQQQGIEVCLTDRGGDITYHGPGQIVAYPILRLNDLHLNIRRYVFQLEQVIIKTLQSHDIQANRDACAVGVWVGGKINENDKANRCNPSDQPCSSGGAKIAAIGVRVKRWITMHGLAINVNPNMEHFKLIVPCGLAGRPVTSMKLQLKKQCPTMDEVRQTLTTHLQNAFNNG